MASEEEEEYRTIDGSGNNIKNPDWGKANAQLRRITRIAYEDGISKPSGANRPNPRTISNIVLDQRGRTTNFKNATDYLWVWGQFLDHDIGLTTAASPSEPYNIKVKTGDPWFDPFKTGKVVIPLNRSIYEQGTGPRQQLNTQSSFIDASNVYGAYEARATELRTNDGTGKLKTGPEGILPYNVNRIANMPSSDSRFYLAGDLRANEQSILIAMHSLFVLEHNRMAHGFYNQDPEQGGEAIYQKVRAKVIALTQAITFNEFLPLLLGEDTISPYSGYKPDVNPDIINVFSTACYRLGHSLVSPNLLRLKEDLTPISEGPLQLRNAFFDPSTATVGGGIEPLLRGAAKQICEELDARTNNELRNFLFGLPGQGGMDLAACNIQRGRDHGLPSYNDVREDLGFPRKASFEDVTSNQETIDRLKEAYDSVEDIDVWIGGLSEDVYKNSMLGELFTIICKMQFEALRDGDRFWHQNTLSADELAEVQTTLLSDIIKRNTRIGDEVQSNVFLV